MSPSMKHLLLSQALANLADVFFRVVIIANVFTLSGSVIATSMVPILIGLSSFVASFLVPLVTRRCALNTLLFYTQAGKTLLLGLLFVGLTQVSVLPLFVLYLFISGISILDGFAAPVSYAIVPRYATDLGKANAAVSMSGESVQLVGWGLGGLLFATVGLSSSLVLILILFSLSTLLMAFLPAVEIEVMGSETNLETLTKGWRLVLKEPKLHFFLQANLLEIAANTLWVSSVILVFVTDVLHQTESYWGYANTAYSLGILGGGLVVYRLSEQILKQKWQSIVLCLGIMTLATGLILLFSTSMSFLLFSLVIGFFSQFKEVPESVFLQESVPERDLVNLYSVFEVVSTVAFSTFVFLMSALTDAFGVFSSVGIAIACLLLEILVVITHRGLLD